MGKRSAGLLIHRQHEGRVEVLLVHPGGPYWAKKDASSWSIPKGLVDEGEDELSAARREVQEEIGHTPKVPSPSSAPTSSRAAGRSSLCGLSLQRSTSTGSSATASPWSGPRVQVS